MSYFFNSIHTDQVNASSGTSFDVNADANVTAGNDVILSTTSLLTSANTTASTGVGTGAVQIAGGIFVGANSDFDAEISMSGNNIRDGPTTLAGFPNASDYITRGAAEQLATGINVLTPVIVATISDLLADATYNNGAGTITSNTNEDINNEAALDTGFSTTLVVGSRILSKNTGAGTPPSDLSNGIYEVTTVGSGAAAWVLTRVTELDNGDDANDAFTLVQEGNTFGGSGFIQVEDPAIVGTDALAWSQFSQSNQNLASVLVNGNDTGATTINISDDASGITSSAGAAATNPGVEIDITAGAGNTTGAGGAIDIDAGAGGATDATGGAIEVTSGAGGGTNGSSGAVTIEAGTVNNSGAGNGGAVNINAGDAGTATGTGAGGDLNLSSGDGGGTSGNAGALTISGGAATSGSGGAVTVSAGNTASGVGGALGLSAGTSGGTNPGGAATLSAGDGGTGAGGNGGAVSVSAGDAGTASGGTGGAATFSSGAGDGAGAGGLTTLSSGSGGTTGNGGAIAVTSAAGGATSGDGGAINVTAGNGQAGNGIGGTISVTAGTSNGTATGGAVTLSSGTGGASSGPGGGIDIIAGAAGGGNAAGGGLNLDAGAGTGTGMGGGVTIDGGAAPGVGDGGSISLTAGATDTGTGGCIDLDAGAANSAGGEGGCININAADGNGTGAGGGINIMGGGSGTGSAGDINVDVGATGAATGGAINVRAGDGATTGGSVLLEAGDGGTVDGDVLIRAGTAGAASGEITFEANGSASAIPFNSSSANETDLDGSLPQNIVGAINALVGGISPGNQRIAYNLTALQIKVANTSNVTVAYFPWIGSRYGPATGLNYQNGVLSYEWDGISGGGTLIIDVFINGVLDVSATESAASGFGTLALTNGNLPGNANERIDVRVRRTVGGSPPDIYALNLEFETSV